MTNVFLLAPALAAIITTAAPQGQSTFSVEVARDCAAEDLWCEGAKRSTYYGGWVRRETAEAGEARVRIATEELVRAARDALCVGPAGEETCERTKAQKRFTVTGLVALEAAIATYESGWREDVAMGRGKSGKPSDDGGQGRGPGGERCYVQIHPSVLDDDRLLGTDREALYRCFRQGAEMLVQARHHCAWAAPKVDRTWATVSLYGTGNSCDSINNGKTRPRVELARKFYAQLQAAERAAKKAGE